jgi:uroporphyrinogen III methyltransferase/synthase
MPTSSTSLSGRNIVIAQPDELSGTLTRELRGYGSAEILVIPQVEISEPEDYAGLDEALSHLYGYDWIIFTSTYAAQYFLRRFKDKGSELISLDELKVCAIPAATEEFFRNERVHVDVAPRGAQAATVFAAIEDFVGGRRAIAALNFLLPCAVLRPDSIAVALKQAGARVDLVSAYRVTLANDANDRGRLAALLSGGADCIVLTSPASLENLGRLFDTTNLSEPLAGVVIAAMNDEGENAASEFGLRVHIKPAPANITALAHAIADYFAST